MPIWLLAWVWGLVAGSALVIGACIGYFAHVAQRVIAGVMAFGAGVLISALALDLMESAYRRGGFVAMSIGFVGGAVVFTAANVALAHYGAKHRKRSGEKQPSEESQGGSGLAIAIGSLLDDIPEAVAIGVSLIAGASVSIVTVAAVFLSNVPESLSSAAGMKQAGRSTGYIFGLWGGIAFLTSLGSLAGYVIFRHLPGGIIAACIAVAAGAILAMLADTMMPEAFEHAHNYAGLITVVGFLLAFILTKL